LFIQLRKAKTYLWDSLSVQADDNSSELFIAVGDIKEDLVRDLWSLSGSFGALGEEDKDQGQNRQQGNQGSLNCSHCE
jgi:hypothetical protein